MKLYELSGIPYLEHPTPSIPDKLPGWTWTTAGTGGGGRSMSFSVSACDSPSTSSTTVSVSVVISGLLFLGVKTPLGIVRVSERVR